MGDVDERDRALALETPELREDVRLRHDVEARGRLVEHHKRRIADEREGDRKPLLLAPGELVREPPLERAAGREVNPLEHAANPLVPVSLERVRAHHLAHVVADPDGRVQCRSRILRHVRDEPAAEATKLMLVAAGNLLTGDPDAAGQNAEPGPRVAEQSLRDRRLATARLPDHAEDLPGGHVERDAFDDDRARPDADPQVIRLSGRIRSTPESLGLDRLSQPRGDRIGDDVDRDRQRRDHQRRVRRRPRD